jgi:GntR family transcriptional regulator
MQPGTAHDPLRVRSDQRPLYAQASEALKALVAREGYAAGDRLPSEIELSRRLGISRPTLREALRHMEEEGAIVRRHGVGTFVATGPAIDAGLEVLESIDRIAERRGLRTGVADLVVEERPATARELQGLGLAGQGDAAAVTAVSRVILAEGRRVAHLTDVAPLGLLRAGELDGATPGEAGPGQRGHTSPTFRSSVLDHFLARGWPALAHSHTNLSAEVAGDDLARALRVPRGAPLLRLEAQLYAQDGRVVDYSISHFLPDFFQFHVVRRIGA